LFGLTVLQPAGLTQSKFQPGSSGAAYFFDGRGFFQTGKPFSEQQAKVFSPSKLFVF